MKKNGLIIFVLLFLLSLLWYLATSFPEQLSFTQMKDPLLQLSGVLAMGLMSIAMLLATRPRWLEPALNGMDKSYHLHKWLGVTGSIIAVCHWLFVMGPKWLTQLGILERQSRREPPLGGGTADASLETLFRAQKNLAETLGEWAFYLVILLIILALVKRFPYRWFAKTHKLLAIVYLVLVFHTIVLMEFSSWSQPLGWLTVLLLLTGTISALLVLLNLVGISCRAQGTIESLEFYPEMQVLETEIKLNERWQGHKAGQFAFITLDKKEGRHPFTIASGWDATDKRIVFLSKSLGDYTVKMPEYCKVGDRVDVEGPYGRFTFDDEKRVQIWVGGGIGITPFIARMKELAQTPGNKEIVLFHAVAKVEDIALNKLRTDAAAANVKLHLLIGKDEGRLDGSKLRAAFPEWQSASVWFCGPTTFGQALRKDLIAKGLSAKDFHQELFHMR
jgi:predicted ferric reductase